MYQLSAKRRLIRETMRKSYKDDLLQSIRVKLLIKQEEKRYEDQSEEVLILAYEGIISGKHDELNLYVNIQSYLKDIMMNRVNNIFLYSLSLWIYIHLTINWQVLCYMVETDAVNVWKIFIEILKNNHKCEEYVLERMKVFLEIFNQEADQINKDVFFCKELTIFLIDMEPTNDEDSEYYQLMSTYINSVPEQHILPIIHHGFAMKSIDFVNNQVFNSILGRLQMFTASNEEYLILYEELLHKKLERQMISLTFN